MSDHEGFHVHADGSVHADHGEEGYAHSHTHSPQSTKTIKNRLARVIGHLHAVERMVDDERDCAEILVQLAAVRSALNNVCKLILRDHMEHCVIDAVQNNDTDAVDALNKAIDLLMK